MPLVVTSPLTWMSLAAVMRTGALSAVTAPPTSMPAFEAMVTEPEGMPPTPLVVIAPPSVTSAPETSSEPPMRVVPWAPLRFSAGVTTIEPGERSVNERPLTHWLVPVPGPEPGTKQVSMVALGPK